MVKKRDEPTGLIVVRELRELDNGERCGYWAKSHYDAAEFLNAVIREFGEDYRDVHRLDIACVRHSYFRNEILPLEIRNECGADHVMTEYGEMDRGCYKVTVIGL